MQTSILIFIRSHRERNFALFVEILKHLAPFFFALDHVNYARYLPIHIYDMENLPTSVHEEFLLGKWVLSKTCNKFSAIPFDQAHENENKYVKGDGGIIGITEKPETMRKWLVAGPELSRLLNTFEDKYSAVKDKSTSHHSQSIGQEKKFLKKVQNLVETINEMGNPFKDDFPELITLDSRKCLQGNSVANLRSLEKRGQDQYEKYVNDVIISKSSSIHDPIKKNNLQIFNVTSKKTVSTKESKVHILKNNAEVFGHLYIAMQNREGDLDNFFAHEIQSFPPSLSDLGNIYFPTSKSDILDCMKIGSKDCNDENQAPCNPEVVILDGGAVIHTLSVKKVSTFAEFADKVFVPHILSQLKVADRVDLVWDVYLENSIKDSTRQKRGLGVRRKVSGNVKLPSNFKDFLSDPTNKTELFQYLNSKLLSLDLPPNKHLIITQGEKVFSVGSNYCDMQNCDHEESDSRVVVHMLNALQHNLSNICIRTVDSDVICILISTFFNLLEIYPALNIWVAFGTSSNFRYIHINSVCSRLDKDFSRAIIAFHAFSGSDTTSSFRGKGKKTAWNAWISFEEVTEAFLFIVEHPFMRIEAESEIFKILKKYVIVLYDKHCTVDSIDQARKYLFCKKQKPMESLPPTRDSLYQHINRVVYQCGIWSSCTKSKLNVPSPSQFSWTMTTESWKTLWISIPQVSKSCKELIHCSCKKGNCSNFSCRKANLPCSEVCKCPYLS